MTTRSALTAFSKVCPSDTLKIAQQLNASYALIPCFAIFLIESDFFEIFITNI